MLRPVVLLLALVPWGVRAGDADGPVLAASCSACHAPAAGDNVIPSLADRSPADIAALLRAYRDGALGGTVMNRLARGYDDDEIAAIAEAIGRPEASP